jgi:hypothetical protein
MEKTKNTSEKKKRIAYWIVAILLALGMLSGGNNKYFI